MEIDRYIDKRDKKLTQATCASCCAKCNQFKRGEAYTPAPPKTHDEIQFR